MEQDIAAINERLDRIIRLLALSLISPEQSIKEKAIALSSAGLSPKEIAEIVGSTPHSVSQTLSAAKKSAGRRKGKKPSTG